MVSEPSVSLSARLGQEWKGNMQRWSNEGETAHREKSPDIGDMESIEHKIALNSA